jgi:hypothetical protein
VLKNGVLTVHLTRNAKGNSKAKFPRAALRG